MANGIQHLLSRVAEYSTALCFERFLGGEFNPTGSGGVWVKGCNPPSDTNVMSHDIGTS